MKGFLYGYDFFWIRDTTEKGSKGDNKQQRKMTYKEREDNRNGGQKDSESEKKRIDKKI